MTANNKMQVRYYRFQNHLRNKATTGFGDDGSPGTISKEALEAAEGEFEKMAEDYPDWVQGHIRNMYVHHSRSVDTPTERAQSFTKLAFIAHDMKGQGGTFGYDLISVIGESLFDFTDTHKDGAIKNDHVELVRAHIDAMKAVIAGRITGDGGPVGAELLNTLGKAKKKFADSMNN